jgi:hypothetical protein
MGFKKVVKTAAAKVAEVSRAGAKAVNLARAYARGEFPCPTRNCPHVGPIGVRGCPCRAFGCACNSRRF